MEKHSFKIFKTKFFFDTLGKKGFFYVACKNPPARLEINGPPADMEKYTSEFRKKYRKTFVKNGKLVAIAKNRIKNAKSLLKDLKTYSRELKEMQIKKVELKNN